MSYFTYTRLVKTEDVSSATLKTPKLRQQLTDRVSVGDDYQQTLRPAPALLHVMRKPPLEE